MNYHFGNLVIGQGLAFMWSVVNEILLLHIRIIILYTLKLSIWGSFIVYKQAMNFEWVFHSLLLHWFLNPFLRL